MIYTVNGVAQNVAYGIDGNAHLPYDVNGNALLGDVLKVATYNVGGWYIGSGTNVPTDRKAEYVPLQQSILSAVDADIVCFQEYWDVFCADGTTANAVIGDYFTQQEKTRTTTTWNGHVIASNGYVISDYQSTDFIHYYSNAPSWEKSYITVGGKRICILNTHLSTAGGGQKEPQSQEMLEAVENETYFVLMGDFNTEATDYDAIVKKFVDAGYHSANLNGTNEWLATYYTTAGVGKPTDQIITSPNIFISNRYIDTTKLTDGLDDKIDHVPLVAELIIT